MRKMFPELFNMTASHQHGHWALGMWLLWLRTWILNFVWFKFIFKQKWSYFIAHILQRNTSNTKPYYNWSILRINSHYTMGLVMVYMSNAPRWSYLQSVTLWHRLSSSGDDIKTCTFVAFGNTRLGLVVPLTSPVHRPWFGPTHWSYFFGDDGIWFLLEMLYH